MQAANRRDARGLPATLPQREHDAPDRRSALRGRTLEEQEAALRPEPENRPQRDLPKKKKDIGHKLKKLFSKKASRAKKARKRDAAFAAVDVSEPMEVQKTQQPLDRLVQELARDTEAMKLVRLDGNTLKLNRDAIASTPNAPGGRDPAAQVQVANPTDLIDPSTLGDPVIAGAANNPHAGGVNGYVVRTHTKDGQPVVVKRPYLVIFDGEESIAPEFTPVDNDVDRTLAARMLVGQEAAAHVVQLLAAGPVTSVVGVAASPEGPVIVDPNGARGRGVYRHTIAEPMVVLGALSETLDQRIGRDGAMSPEEAKRHGSSLLRVVAAMQRAGLAHNDMKSDNIMFDTAGELVLIDFGEMSSQDGVFEAASGATGTWPINYKDEGIGKKDSWTVGLNLITMLGGGKTANVGGELSGATSQNEVDQALDGVLARVEGEDEGALAELKAAIRSLLKYDEGERATCEEALALLT